jgi:DME family drug/metabolite transporter
VLAVGLALVSALLFGAMTVALRIAVKRTGEVELGAAAILLAALTVSLFALAVEAFRHGVAITDVWPFALAGIFAPGASQILFTLAVREVGASRTSVLVGMAPLVSVTLALALLGEPAEVPLLVGAVLIVAGGVELARERGRPAHLRMIGLAYAAGATILFASRDNLVRHLAGTTEVRPAAATTVTLLAGLVVAAGYAACRRPREIWAPVVAFAPAGMLLGISYLALFGAYYRGRVTVVSPLVATESLWGVALSAVLLRRSELVSRQLVLGAVLIVAGGVLIGVFR